MKVYLVLGFVCFTLFLQIRFCSAGRKGSGPSLPGRARPRPRPSSSNWRTNEGLGVCQAQGRGIRTLQNKIIRTKDSIDNGACFANAIVVGSIDECSARCCSFSGDDCDGKCDTSIFVRETDDNDNGDEVNCFLFVCGDGEDCKFSYHSGYTTTMILKRQERTEQPSPIVKKTTTTPPIQLQTTHSARSTTTTTWDLPTTTKQEIVHRPSPSPNQVLPVIDEIYEEKEDEDSYNHNSHGCGRLRFKCGSGECFKFSYICDGIIDCRDNSDETDCDYSSSQDYSANEYDNEDTFDEDHEDINAITTTEPPDQDKKFEGISSIIPTTTTKSNRNTSENTITQSSGNTTEAPKRTLPNSSNKHGSSRKHLFKAKSPLTDKPLTSAILPLAFGLLITVLLLLLVGCRLRQVNRRLRYGRLKTNVAEADYLINGMYL